MAVEATVAVGSIVLVLVGVFIELLYLGVGIVCSSVSVGVDVTVGMILDSAPQALVNMETSKVKIKSRFIMIKI